MPQKSKSLLAVLLMIFSALAGCLETTGTVDQITDSTGDGDGNQTTNHTNDGNTTDDVDDNVTIDCPAIYDIYECIDTDGCQYVEEFDEDGNAITGYCVSDTNDTNDGNTTDNVGDNNTSDNSTAVDSDGDGIPDNLELTQYGTDPYDADTDGDGFSDGFEIINGLNPLVENVVWVDTDNDGMEDIWEEDYGLNSSNSSDASLDGDIDGLTNLEEYLNGTDPTNWDTDNDGLPDGYEVVHGFNPLNSGDANADPDGDGLTNLEEFNGESNPWNADTDGDGVNDANDPFPSDPNDGDWDQDGMSDIWEYNNGLNNSDAYDSYLDGDNDALTNLQEYLNGTNPNSNDTDNDGLPDPYEVALGFDPLNSGDANADPDGDGLMNLEEFNHPHSPERNPHLVGSFPVNWTLCLDYGIQNPSTACGGTNPHDADTDGDGKVDSNDPFPLDPNQGEFTDMDGDGILDAQDSFPVDPTEWFDSDGDGIGNNADPSPWLPSNGNGSFDMNYTMVGFVQGHNLYWLGSTYHAYYYSSTPDQIWNDGERASVFSITDMPNVNATLSLLGMSVDNLSVQSRPLHLGNDTRYIDWDYDGSTGIEWRILRGNLSVLYLDDMPLFAINVTLHMYLDYSGLMSGGDVTMQGSSDSGALINMAGTSFHDLLYRAFLNDFSNGTINYSFNSQDAIISTDYEYSSPPTNATTLLSSLVGSEGSVPVGIFDTIISTIHANQSQVGGNAVNTPNNSTSFASYFEGINTENRRTDEESN